MLCKPSEVVLHDGGNDPLMECTDSQNKMRKINMSLNLG